MQMSKIVTLTIPLIKKQVKTPKLIQKLVFELNYRGFYTKDVEWGDPFEIKMESFDWFWKNVKLWRMSPKKQIRELYLYLVHNIEFKIKLADPLVVGNRSDKDLFEIALILPHSKVDTLTKLFHRAHVK